MLQELAFRIARRRVHRSESLPTGSELSSAKNHDQWREHTLEEEYLRYFSPDIVRDKDVLDFGCGEGALSFHLIRLGARSCIGVDLDQKDLDSANSKIRGESISFRRASNTTKVELENESVDVIVCFDVVEHIMEYESIIREWHRVLRPGGKVLIHWQPWFHPNGHHGQAYIPIPWVHVFLNNRKRVEVCARIVELPEFDAPFWDRDENGKRINRFREALESGKADEEDFLNKLTMRRFERLSKEAGFHIEKRIRTTFEGSFVVQNISWLFSKIPLVREFFTANAVYVLSKQFRHS